MIGHIQGEVLFSDGNEIILLTNSGIGYQIYYNKVFAEGSYASLYISHVIRESSQDLYGFHTLRAKKLFELLTTVKGVGPKSASALVASIGVNQVCDAIAFEDKTLLKQAPGVGNKAASQIILDLAKKIHKVKMFSSNYKVSKIKAISDFEIVEELSPESLALESDDSVNQHQLINDTLMACKELGFKEDKIVPLAQDILSKNSISRPEQLVHLVLKEI